MSAINPFDTTKCPRGWRCESCGTDEGPLDVLTVRSPLGVMCLTLCGQCVDFRDRIPISVNTAVRLVAQHAGHVGGTVDDLDVDR